MNPEDRQSALNALRSELEFFVPAFERMAAVPGTTPKARRFSAFAKRCLQFPEVHVIRNNRRTMSDAQVLAAVSVMRRFLEDEWRGLELTLGAAELGAMEDANRALTGDVGKLLRDVDALLEDGD